MYNCRNERKVYLNKGSALVKSHPSNGRSNEHVENLRNIPSNWLIYDEISRSNTSYTIRSVTSVSPITVSLVIQLKKLKLKNLIKSGLDCIVRG